MRHIDLGNKGRWLRTLCLMGVMLTSWQVFAQQMQVKRHEKASAYQLIDGNGRAMTNYIFDRAELDSVHNYAKVRFHGVDFLVGADGNILVPIHEPNNRDFKTLEYVVCVEHPKTDEMDVYDYQGHLLMEGVNRLYVSATVKMPDGRSIDLYTLRRKEGEPYVTLTPDLKPFADYNVQTVDSKHMTIEEVGASKTKTLRNLRGDVLVSNAQGGDYNSLSRAVPYSKAGKPIQALYTQEEYEKLEVYACYNFSSLSIYSPDGRMLGEFKQKSILDNNKTLAKAWKKTLVPYLLQRQENERLIHERLEVPMEELFQHNTAPDPSDAKPIERVALTSLLPRYTNTTLFPVVHPEEMNATPTKQVDQRLRTSKYGKVKDYKLVVEADGMMYYEQNYTNGSMGLANTKGNVIIPPTKDLIVYHSTGQYFAVFDRTYDEANECYPSHQLYDWDGHLLMDLVKKKYGPNANFFLEKEGLAYMEVQKGDQKAAFDYFGVQLTPWLSRGFYYSDTDKSFNYSDDYASTGYTLPNTSHRGGKASAAKKFPAQAANTSVAAKSNAKGTTTATASTTTTNATSTTAASEAPATTSAAANAVNEQAMSDMRKNMRDDYWSQYERATTSQAKMEALMQCLPYCDDKASMGSVLCNIGVLYANSGQTEMAMAYYKQAVECGNGVAQSNLNNLLKAQRRQSRLDKWSAIGNALTQMGNSMAGSMGNNGGGGGGNFLQGFVQGMSSGGRGLLGAVTGSNAGSGPLTPKHPNGTKLSDGGMYMFFDSGVGQTEYISYDDGSATVTTVQQCYSCVTTGGKCLTCQGSGNGYYMLQAADRYMQCPACGGSGTCGTCHGSQWLPPFTKHFAPGEAEAYMQAVREVKANSSSTSSSSSSSSSSASTKGHTCSRCHGSKYEKTRESFNNGSGQHPSYHNSAGVSCSICGDSSEHYHSVCARCVGLGREY